jgi:hypothetical protein
MEAQAQVNALVQGDFTSDHLSKGIKRSMKRKANEQSNQVKEVNKAQAKLLAQNENSKLLKKSEKILRDKKNSAFAEKRKLQQVVIKTSQVLECSINFMLSLI